MSERNGTLPRDFMPQAQLTRAPEITMPRAPFIENFSHRFVNFGSCFAQNIKRALDPLGFRSFFISEISAHYNTETLAHKFEAIASGREATQGDLFIQGDKVYAFRNHIKYPFRGRNAVADALERITGLHSLVREEIEAADTLIITLGTSRLARLRDNGEPILVVGGLFEDHWALEMLSIQQNIKNLRRVCAALGSMRGGRPMNVVFTVSPQRYLYGKQLHGDAFPYWGGSALVDNFLSKCYLRAAVEDLVLSPPAGLTIHYFPALEIVYEELRQFETLAHYDYVRIAQHHTADLVVKKFLLTYAAVPILEQLSASEKIQATMIAMDKIRQGGAPLNDSEILALVEGVEDELGRFGDELSEPLLNVWVRLRCDYDRLLPKRLTAFPRHGPFSIIAEAQLLMNASRRGEAQEMLTRLMDDIGPRRSKDGDAGEVQEHAVYRLAASTLEKIQLTPV